MLTIVKRLVTVIPTLIGVVIVTFLLTRVLPGDPAVYFAGPAATPQSIAEIRKSLGLDRPLPDQFAHYVNDLVHGNFGNSLSTGRPVATEISSRLPASAELTLSGLILAIVIAVPLGIFAAVKQGSWIDHLCRVIATAGRMPTRTVSAPNNREMDPIMVSIRPMKESTISTAVMSMITPVARVATSSVARSS